MERFKQANKYKKIEFEKSSKLAELESFKSRFICRYYKPSAFIFCKLILPNKLNK